MDNERTIGEYPEPELLYADLREKWKHEDDLVNRRVTWLLQSQLFMLTGFGVLAKWQLGERPETGPCLLVHLDPKILVVGVVVSLLALWVAHVLGVGIHAAFAAMTQLKKQVRSHRRHGRLWPHQRVDVLTTTRDEGARGPKGLVYAFYLVWGLLLVATLTGLSLRLG